MNGKMSHKGHTKTKKEEGETIPDGSNVKRRSIVHGGI